MLPSFSEWYTWPGPHYVYLKLSCISSKVFSITTHFDILSSDSSTFQALLDSCCVLIYVSLSPFYLCTAFYFCQSFALRLSILYLLCIILYSYALNVIHSLVYAISHLSFSLINLWKLVVFIFLN